MASKAGETLLLNRVEAAPELDGAMASALAVVL
jgi:hypothetical protein